MFTWHFLVQVQLATMSRVKTFSALEILLCHDCIPRAGLHNSWVCSISSTAAHGQPAHTRCDRINFLCLDLLKTTYNVHNSCKTQHIMFFIIVHQGSLTLSDFIIRLKLISILGLSFSGVNVICNWWRSRTSGPATGKCGLSRAGRRRDLMLD